MTAQPGQMIGQPIAPPPSIDDILATPAQDRLIGRVDFSTLLVPEPEPEAEPVAASDPVVTAASGPVVTAEPEPVVAAEPEPAPFAPEPEVLDVPLRAVSSADAPLVDAPLVDDVTHLAVSVEEIAATVIERMQQAGAAHLRHLEAIESETARRCELVTAQAELDAELIRLHARREAHTILADARSRTGDDHRPGAEGQSLSHISESFSRFAESIETDIAQTSAPHDLRPTS